MQALRRPEQYAACHPGAVPRFLPAALLLSCLSIHAQSLTEGALHGIHADPGSTVTISAQGLDHPLSTVAFRDGSFLFANLAPGTYALGSSVLTISANETTEVTVTPNGIVVAASASTDEEPNPDQDADGLLSFGGLASTQTASVSDGVTQDQGYSSAPRGTASDGAQDDDGQPALEGLGRSRPRGVSYSFSAAAIQEFRVAGSYSALIGGAAGGLTTSVTRHGGDTLHGSAAYDLRSSAFAAANPLAIATSYSDGAVTSGIVKPQDLRQTFVATLGGPASRLPGFHYFATVDVLARNFPAISSPGDPNFYNLTATQQALLSTRGVSSAATETALNYLSSLTGELPRSSRQTITFLRLDTKPIHRQTVSLSWNRVRSTSPAGLTSAPVVARGRASLGNTSGSLDGVLLTLTSTVKPHLRNQLRLQYARSLQFVTPQSPLPQEPAIGPGGLAPEVNIGPDGLEFGTPNGVTKSALPLERRLQAADTVAWSHPHHTLQLGVDLSALSDESSSLPNPAGTFSYDSGLVNGKAGGLVDFITDYTFNVNAYPNEGCPSIRASPHYFCFRSFSQGFGPQTVAFKTQDWAAFLEHTWRPRGHITLATGLRYEYQLLPLPQQPNPALDTIFGATGKTGVFPEDRNNLAPRVALSLAPFGSRAPTVHFGYGIFFGRVPGATIAAALTDTALPSVSTRIRITPTSTIACPQAANQGFGYPCTYVSPPPAVVAATTSAVLFDSHFRLPVVQRASFSFEQQFKRHAFLSVGYVLNLDRQLPGTTDLNIAPSPGYGLFQLSGGSGAPGVQSGETFALPLYTTRLNTSFGPVTDLHSGVNASYNALELKAQLRPLRTLDLNAAYTWSKAIDLGQLSSATPRTNTQLDPFEARYDKALSALNYPQSFHLHATWEHTSHLKILNSWRVAPVLVVRSGKPYSLNIFGGSALSGGHESINGSGGAVYLPTVGRNTLRLPTTFDLDLRVSRELVLPRTERIHLHAYAEAFNLTNHRFLTSVNQRAFLVCTATNPACPAAPVPTPGIPAVTTLLFQSAANIALEGLNTQPFAAPTAAGSGTTRERQVQLGILLNF